MSLALLMLTGGTAFSQTQAGDTPDPPQTIQEEPTVSADQGGVVERGMSRDHRGQPKFSAPPKTTAPSQVTPAPIVRDHRQQPGGTTSSAPVAAAQGAPPPIGPPDPVAPVQELPIHLTITNLRDKNGKNIGVRGQVDTAIAAVNANMAQQTSIRAKILVESFTVYGPNMSATTYTDRPNQRYVAIPYMVGYKVYDVQKNIKGEWFNTSVTRKISHSITIQMFCDKWETGKGALKLVAKIDRPYMDPNQGGTLEQVVNFFLNGHLTDFIDSQVRQQISVIPITNGSTNLPFACNALSRDQGAANTPTDDLVVYSDHRAPGSVVTGTTALNQISVNLVGLRRLVAHDLYGAVLYQASEAPALEFYANSQHFYLPLSPIQEGQQIPLNAQPLRMNPPGNNEPLVLVANIIQNVAVNTQPTDSAFLVLGKTMNYGNGTRTIRIPKFYIVQANPKTGAKPYKVPVDAYELTVQITAPGNLSADPGLGTSPTPGTVKPGLFNQAIQGTIMKRGVEGEQPETESGTPEGGAPPPTAP
ncbi:MAG: hypothetical protein OEM58_04710 [Nitrospirota bacterium]|nr:hypothetical protein [Nitrospirota bacterium]